MSGLDDRKANGLPLYQSVIHKLGSDLDAGRWKPGGLLPTETELSREFDVSPGTIRQAILSLVRSGLLTRRAGKGTFVARLDTSRRGFGRFFRFRDDLRGAVEPTVHHLDTVVIGASNSAIAAKLGIAAGAPILRIRRMLVHNGQNICLYVSHLDLGRFAVLQDIQLENRRLYAVIDEVVGVHVLKAEELLEAGSASAEEAGLLGIQTGTPVMLIERTAFGSGGRVVEWRRSVGRSDQFHYRIELP